MRSIHRSIFLICIALFFCTQRAVAQDYNFSQFWENRTYYNPAFAGLNQGEVNTLLTYRKLWPKFQGNFSTIFFSADIKTHNNYGFGLYAVSSDEGGGFIKSNTVGLSYSWRGYINKVKNMYFQLGVKGDYNNERTNLNKYIYSQDLHEIYGQISTTELDGLKNKGNYWDFAVGGMVCLPWERHYKEFMTNYIGFAVSHFTRPKNSFIDGDSKLPIKVNFQWNAFIRTNLYSLDKKNFLYVNPGLLFENQGEKLMSSSSSNNIMVGADVTTDPIFGGVWYSSQVLNNSEENYKAMIFKLGLKLESEKKTIQYRLAYSYDMSLGNLAKSTEGSHEISLNVIFKFNARYRYNLFKL